MIFKFLQKAPTIPLFSSFTFQSGDIQIIPRHHSYVEAYLFTFQSGDIQISLSKPSAFNKSPFTFQSGDIQIKKKLPLVGNIACIYIPIW